MPELPSWSTPSEAAEMPEAGVAACATLAFETSPVPLALVSLDPARAGRLVDVSSSLCRLTGHSRAALLGMSLDRLIAPQEQASEHELLDLLAGRISSYRVEARLLDAEGRLRWVEGEVWALGDGDDAHGHAMARLQDITERRRMAYALRAEQATWRALSHSATLEGALPALLSGLGEAFEADFCAAWLAEDDQERLRCQAIWQPAAAPKPRFTKVTRETALEPGAGLPGRVWTTAQPAVVEDVVADRDFVRAPTAAEDGLHGGLALPLVVGSECVGAIELLTAAPRERDGDMLALLESVASQIADFSARLRAEQRPVRTPQLLLVEDNDFVVRLVGEMLQESELSLELVAVASLAAARARLLAARPACVLLDLTLPDADGLKALLELRELAPDVPVVVLTGREDENLAMQAVRAGAQDYLVKRKVDFHGLARSIRYAIERKHTEQQVLDHMLRDPLTDLPNRMLFLDRLRVALARADEARSVAVLLVDIDRFRMVNDSLGHENGDRLIRAVAERLAGVAGPDVTVASFGADQFAVLLESIESELEAVDVSDRLAAAVSEPVELAGENVTSTATIGITLAGGESRDGDDVIREAETALYRGKDLGGGRYEIFEEGVRGRMRERLLIETGLRAGVENREFELLYQPILSFDDGSIVALEALLRWRHPERGLLSPGEFLEVAEESGLIVPIGEWAIDEACRQLATWQRELPGCDRLQVNVNLCARQLADPHVVEKVSGALERFAPAAGSLCIEITESSLMRDLDLAAERLCQLKALDAQIALDDFGTGYSSLSYVTRFPLDFLKLDRSFVLALGREKSDAALVGAVANMGEALGLPVVAEGVETEEHVRELRAAGYELGQGYHFARPLSASAAAEMLGSRAL